MAGQIPVYFPTLCKRRKKFAHILQNPFFYIGLSRKAVQHENIRSCPVSSSSFKLPDDIRIHHPFHLLSSVDHLDTNIGIFHLEPYGSPWRIRYFSDRSRPYTVSVDVGTEMVSGSYT